MGEEISTQVIDLYQSIFHFPNWGEDLNSDIKPKYLVVNPEKVITTRGDNSDVIENTKFEYRNPKQIRNSNAQRLKTRKKKQ